MPLSLVVCVYINDDNTHTELTANDESITVQGQKQPASCIASTRVGCFIDLVYSSP